MIFLSLRSIKFYVHTFKFSFRGFSRLKLVDRKLVVCVLIKGQKAFEVWSLFGQTGHGRMNVLESSKTIKGILV